MAAHRGLGLEWVVVDFPEICQARFRQPTSAT